MATQYLFPLGSDPLKAPQNRAGQATHVEAVNKRPNGVLTRGARTAVMPPHEDTRIFNEAEQMRFVELPDYPRQSREQGVGKSPGFRMPWRNVWVSLIDKGLKQMPPIRVWRELPSRPEQQGWSAAYLLYFEQRNRHVWPGGGAQGGNRVIEHPESVSLTSLARGFGKR